MPLSKRKAKRSDVLPFSIIIIRIIIHQECDDTVNKPKENDFFRMNEKKYKKRKNIFHLQKFYAIMKVRNGNEGKSGGIHEIKI